MPKPKDKTISYDRYNLKGEKVSREDLIDQFFDETDYSKLLAQTVRVYLANQRQGTSSTKTRGMVAGSTRKIYRQKGTGRARHGDIKAPLFVGGGIIFGPHPRDFQLHLNKKMKKKAFLLSIVDKIRNNKFIVINDLSKIPPKTKILYSLIKKIYPKKEKLLLINGGNKNLLLACRNMPNITPSYIDTVNTYDILSHSSILVDQDILEKLLRRLDVTSEGRSSDLRRSVGILKKKTPRVLTHEVLPKKSAS